MNTLKEMCVKNTTGKITSTWEFFFNKKELWLILHSESTLSKSVKKFFFWGGGSTDKIFTLKKNNQVRIKTIVFI